MKTPEKVEAAIRRIRQNEDLHLVLSYVSTIENENEKLRDDLFNAVTAGALLESRIEEHEKSMKAWMVSRPIFQFESEEK